MLVSDIMTLDPDCCTAESTANAAAAQMRKWSTGILPVVENTESKRVIGVITDRDLCIAVVAEGRNPAQTPVVECMTREAVVCLAGEPVARALDRMREHRVRRLPVVDSEERLVGIISLTDVIRYAALAESEIVTAVAHINEPRVASARLGSAEVGPTSH